MALMIRKPALETPIRRGKSKRQPEYLAALHLLPCVISGRPGVEAAHISFASKEYGHDGRAKATKAGDRWCLPLLPELHAAQHRMNEAEFWRNHGIDPHRLALIIHGLWCEYGEDFVDYAEAVIMANIQERRA